jgi:hypothetical protein
MTIAGCLFDGRLQHFQSLYELETDWWDVYYAILTIAKIWCFMAFEGMTATQKDHIEIKVMTDNG